MWIERKKMIEQPGKKKMLLNMVEQNVDASLKKKIYEKAFSDHGSGFSIERKCLCRISRKIL